MELEVLDLHVEVVGKEILKGVNLTVGSGEIVALMGPNGAGKSSLDYALMGHPSYKITSGKILLNSEDITNLSPDQRAKKGIFLSFQYPSEVPGVTMSNFLRTAVNSNSKKPLPISDFVKQLKEAMSLLKIDQSFMHRYLNEGFSGGEKKRAEILQLAVLKPEIAILDETDSGLDVDSLKIVADGINRIKQEDSKMGILLITHYQRILNYIRPDNVYIMMEGKIVKSGKAELVHKIESEGYAKMVG